MLNEVNLCRTTRAALMLTWALCAPAYLAAQDDPSADAEPQKRLIERDPFDRVVLNNANDNAVLEVDVASFPVRRVERGRPSDEITLQVKSIESSETSKFFTEPDEFKIAWRDIVQVELFEQMLLVEANRLVADRNFVEAFEYFEFLLGNYPQTAGLSESLQTYLYEDAVNLLRQKEYSATLSLLEDLHTRNPAYRHAATGRTVGQAMAVVVDRIIGEYEAKDDFASLRTLLSRIRRQYGDAQREIVDKWQRRLRQLAAEQMAQARSYLDQQRARQAGQALRRMKDILPTAPGGDALVAELQRKFPLVVVGVNQIGSRGDRLALADWAARRTGYLTQRMFAEFSGYGAEGGQYECSLGGFELSDDRMRLTIRLVAGSAGRGGVELTGYDVSQRLLSLANPANPEYSAFLNGMVGRVEVEDVMQVHLQLQHAHVLPQAALQIPVFAGISDSASWASGNATHRLSDRTDREAYFVVHPAWKALAGEPRLEIVEQVLGDFRQASEALMRGDVDVLDRITPDEAVRLRLVDSLVVKKYALPTVHVLVPNARKPHMANRTFRRAIAYGINRERILKNDLLRGASVTGCEVVSGPFPKGVAGAEGLGYAYNDNPNEVELRPYNPRMAIALGEMARREVAEAALKRNKPVPQRVALVIGYLPYELPRRACEVIAAQLKPVGFPSVLLELPPDFSIGPDGEWLLFTADEKFRAELTKNLFPEPLRKEFERRSLPLSGKAVVTGGEESNGDRDRPGAWRLADEELGIAYDLRIQDGRIVVSIAGDLLYAELAMWEPLLDVQRMFGKGGVAETDNPYVNLALRDVQSADNWEDVGDRMHRLHRTVHDELAIIPLWQMVNHFAHRRELSGVADDPVVLYQDMSRWKVNPSAAPP